MLGMIDLGVFKGFVNKELDDEEIITLLPADLSLDLGLEGPAQHSSHLTNNLSVADTCVSIFFSTVQTLKLMIQNNVKKFKPMLGLFLCQNKNEM